MRAAFVKLSVPFVKRTAIVYLTFKLHFAQNIERHTYLSYALNAVVGGFTISRNHHVEQLLVANGDGGIGLCTLSGIEQSALNLHYIVVDG